MLRDVYKTAHVTRRFVCHCGEFVGGRRELRNESSPKFTAFVLMVECFPATLLDSSNLLALKQHNVNHQPLRKYIAGIPRILCWGESYADGIKSNKCREFTARSLSTASFTWAKTVVINLTRRQVSQVSSVDFFNVFLLEILIVPWPSFYKSFNRMCGLQ